MKPITKAVAVALIQILLISSVGAKLLFDRRACPRAWFKTRRYDPNLPIRGRYVSLQLEVKDSRLAEEIEAKFGNEIRAEENRRVKYQQHGPFMFGRECGSIAVRDGEAVAVFEQSGVHDGGPVARYDQMPPVASWNCKDLSFTRQRSESATDNTTLRLNEAVLFFIPDTAEDP